MRGAEWEVVVGRGHKKELRPRTGGCRGLGSQTDSGEGETLFWRRPSEGRNSKCREDERRTCVLRRNCGCGDRKNVDEERSRWAVCTEGAFRAFESGVLGGRGPRCSAGDPSFPRKQVAEVWAPVSSAAKPLAPPAVGLVPKSCRGSAWAWGAGRRPPALLLLRAH